MNKKSRIGIVAALAVMVGVVLAVKQANRQPVTDGQDSCCPLIPNLVTLPISNNVPSNPEPASPAATPTATPASASSETKSLPKLVDVGAGRCIPCKLMAPILEELRTNNAGRLEVVFVDVWENPDAGKPYNIEMIPTQIFFDADGNELFRHTGFFGKEDILAKWKELGVDLK
jgi:thioredoxin 1